MSCKSQVYNTAIQLYTCVCVYMCVCVCVCVHMCAQLLSHVLLFIIPWTVARQAPLSMGFSRQESWSGLPCPSPGDLSHPGICLLGLWHWQMDSLPLCHLGSPTYTYFQIFALIVYYKTMGIVPCTHNHHYMLYKLTMK